MRTVVAARELRKQRAYRAYVKRLIDEQEMRLKRKRRDEEMEDRGQMQLQLQLQEERQRQLKAQDDHRKKWQRDQVVRRRVALFGAGEGGSE